MASIQKESVDEQHCVLCCDDIEFSACGSCDHPICLKCCVKLRMLRKENDCPVCRAQLKEVIVSKGYKSWALKSLRPQPRQLFRDYGIHHESPDSQAKVDELLHHKCPICGEISKTFAQAKDHIRKIHSSYYCDICLRHLKIFTHERRCYTREALVRHRKKGDADDKSHRGHPLCQFCDERYLDDDELLSHLRKTHFWCHLCEKDGNQDYFPQYKELRKHFQTSHFLCEEDECVDEKFTSVFRAKMDYQAHIAQKHSNRLTKAEARQARQVEIDFRFVPRQTDSAGVVSNRDYSFPEQWNDRNFARRLGNRDRASGGASGSGRQDSTYSREGSGDSPGRSVRNKGTDRDAGRATKDSRQEKEKAKDSLKVTRGLDKNKEKNKNGGKIAKGPAQDKSTQRGRTSKGDKDCEGTSRDTVNGMKSMEMSQDKRKDKNVVSASKEVVQGDIPPKKQNSKNSHFVSESNNPSINEAVAIQKMTEKNELVPQPAKDNSNGLVNLSSKTKTDTQIYVDDFPALTLSVKQPVASNSAPNYEQSSNRSTKKKTARSTNIKVPVHKQNYHDAFPSLIAMSNGQGTSATKAPPGFAAPVQPSHRPPPGLKWSVPPPGLAGAGAGATAVVNSGNSGSSNKRDQQIIREINCILDYRGQSFLRFREVSGQFRQGNLSAKRYYHECCGLLGEENMQKVFKELIDLLPDEEKRRELLGVYNDAKICSKQVQVEPTMSSSTKGFTNSSVTTSSHVLLQEGDFPALPGSAAKKPLKSQQKAAGAWVRGR